MFNTPQEKKNSGHRATKSISTSRSFMAPSSFDYINTSFIQNNTSSRGRRKTQTKQVRICDVLQFLVVGAINDKYLLHEQLPDSVLIEKYNSDPLLRNRINLKINKFMLYKNKNGGKPIQDEHILTQAEDQINKSQHIEDTITFSNFKQKQQANQMKLYERYYKLFGHSSKV